MVRVFASPADRAEAKAKLLSLIEGTDRGARADEAKQKEIEVRVTARPHRHRQGHRVLLV